VIYLTLLRVDTVTYKVHYCEQLGKN